MHDPYKKANEMRAKSSIGMKEAIEKWLDVSRLRSKFDESSIIAAWPDIIGRAIANRTEKIYIHDKKLFVRVESAVIKNELVLMRQQIIARANEHAGRTVVEECVVL